MPFASGRLLHACCDRDDWMAGLQLRSLLSTDPVDDKVVLWASLFEHGSGGRLGIQFNLF